jgi:type IV pilus assembly protein PilB
MAEPAPQSTEALYAETEQTSVPTDHVGEQMKARRLAARYQLEFVDLEHFNIDHALFRSIPADLMLRYGFVPYRRDGNTLLIVVSDPSDLQTIDEVGVQLGMPIRVCVGTPSSIQNILKKSESSTRVLEEATEGFQIQILREDESGEENLTVEKLTSGDSPVIRLVDSMVFTALQRRASDIHVETQDDAVHVKYRIDGVLQQAMRPVDKRFHSTIISRIKVMAELDIAEKRVPQDGRFKLKVRGKAIDFRVSIMPSVHGEDAVIRILDKESISEQFTELRLDILGWPEEEMRRFRKYIREPYGMVLVTGPTGSGKTTTLYAALSEIKTVEDKIVTIEDPVEYQLRGITQIPINEKKGLTFARGLRSILRHDPDKIMVGEIRDPETAQIAIQSALTGHLVFTTVHANNVIDVLGRFLNMGVEAYQFVSALNCVLAQRLVRRICDRCVETYAPSSDDFQELKKQFGDNARFDALKVDRKKVTLSRGKGCEACFNTGYRGRTSIHEFLVITAAVRKLVQQKASADVITKAGRDGGMLTLKQDGIRKVFKGLTDLREVMSMTLEEDL